MNQTQIQMFYKKVNMSSEKLLFLSGVFFLHAAESLFQVCALVFVCLNVQGRVMTARDIWRGFKEKHMMAYFLQRSANNVSFWFHFASVWVCQNK